MTAGIYKITHKDSGKCYIGSSVDVQRRIYRHRSDLKLNKHINPILQRAVNKYGLDAFSFEKILVCREEDLLMYENSIIGTYQSNKDGLGYNIRIHANSNLELLKPSGRLPGEKFGRWTLVSLAHTRYAGERWNVKCECGSEGVKRLYSLTNGTSASCGCYRNEVTKSRSSLAPGVKFNRLTVIDRTGKDKRGKSLWSFQCDCGNTIERRGDLISCGTIMSCGCLAKEYQDSVSSKFAHLRLEAAA